jgi:2-oxoacid:acceptor oxidoreductase delta subunit (pyruvate/2-ketoisovalerate family)
MGNVAVLGACIRLLLPDGLPFLEEAVSARFGGLAGPNLAAAREGYARCIRQHTRAGDAPVAASVAGPGPPADALFPISLTDCRSNHTGSWSEEQPVLTDECTACALCALFCPEGAISRVDGHMLVDALYCKGCGICEVVCPVRGAVHMDEVRG